MSSPLESTLAAIVRKQRLQRLIDLHEDAMRSRVFGFYSQRPRPVASESAVRAFEERHGCVLPQAYRDHVLVVGNGGYGPGYGLFAMGEAINDDAPMDNMNLRDVFDPARFTGIVWPEFSDTVSEEQELELERQLDALYSQAPGAMYINHDGCALRSLLIVTGELRGCIAYDRRSEQGDIEVLRSEFSDRPLGFDEWYDRWLSAAEATVR